MCVCVCVYIIIQFTRTVFVYDVSYSALVTSGLAHTYT